MSTDKKVMEVLLNRINELSKKVSVTNETLDNVVNILSNMQIKIRTNESRIEELESNSPDNSNNSNNVQVVKRPIKHADTKQNAEILTRIDNIDRDIDRLKNIISSLILREKVYSSEESENNDDDWDSRVNSLETLSDIPKNIDE